MPLLQGLVSRDVEANAWIGLIAPAKTADSAIISIHRDVTEVLRDPDIRNKLHTQYMESLGTSPDEFKMHIETEMQRWTPVIRASNVKIN